MRKNFFWGTDTSAFQVEGAWNEDGKGESIWDRFCHDRRGNKVYHNENADVAIDQYHRYKEDMKLLGTFGVNAHRFSVAWTRILPEGTGKINKAGIQYYHNLIDEMKGYGVEPFMTMYHWDLPQALQDRGGWANPECVDWWLEYANVLIDEFGSKVKYWITYNEPYVFIFGGYSAGHFPPNIQCYKTACQAGHYAMKAHFETVKLIHERIPGAQVGIALDMVPRVPATDRKEDIDIVPLANDTAFYWFYNVMATGEYPPLAVEEYKKRGYMFEISDYDRRLFKENPCDFIGINYYSTMAVKYTEDEGIDGFHYLPVPREEKYGTIEKDPEGLRNILKKCWKDTEGKIPIIVTENGCGGDADCLGPDGKCHDEYRINYLKDHSQVVKDCIAEGLDIRGYFVWSFWDIFEWSLGTGARYGLTHVDYETQVRTPKDSFFWYKQFIKDNTVE
ncbi:MAG: family 1 glycosylhydrolase [Clostridia bacterium]|nr:family 1 glycosylhydrolase [Clostridia bacterium]